MDAHEVRRYMLQPKECKYKVGSFISGFAEAAPATVTEASSADKRVRDCIAHLLYNTTVVPVEDSQYAKAPKFIPGSTIDGPPGPLNGEPTVMVIGKIMEESDYSMSTLEDILDLILGKSKDFLFEAFREVGIPVSKCYFTNLIKFPRLDHNWAKPVSRTWIKESLCLLEQEIYLVQPKVVLCLGTDASKAITGYPVSKAMSKIHECDVGAYTAKVVCVNDPRKIITKSPEERPQFIGGLKLVKAAIQGEDVAEVDRSGYQYVDNVDQLSELVDRLIQEGHTEFSIDCEWGGGQHHLDENAALRTIQIAWSGTECMVVVLHRQGMRRAFKPNLAAAAFHLRRLLQRPEAKFIGHNLGADLPWLQDFGVDLEGQVYFDTMLASHLFEPTMSHKLEDLATKHLAGWTRQDFELTEWLTNNKEDDGEAFANVPDSMLHPYSGDDVICTWRLYKYYKDRFEEPGFEKLRNLFYTVIMPATLEIIRIEINGVVMDRQRLEELSRDYKSMHDHLLARFRRKIGQPHFNPNSSNQKAELLFTYLGLTPIKTTDKPAVMWEEVVEQGMEDRVTPSTDGETLETLAKENKLVDDLHKITLLGTTLKNQLCPKETDPRTGREEYVSGFLSYVKPDGRIHTRISQMLKTGRLASRDPNIMNIANKQEKAVQEVFKADEMFGFSVPKLRSTFTVPPRHLMVVSDYKQAEIAALANLSGDPTLIESVSKGLDIHSVVCRDMFKLDCTLEEVKVHHKALRVAAKSIVFGLLYGRGPKAIAREVEKAGVSCSVREAREFVETFMSQFPLVSKLIDDTHLQVEQLGYVDTVWGRRAFYPKIQSEEYEGILAGQKRQAFNLLIQGYVADMLRVALIAFGEYRRNHPDVKYKIILTVHDSIVAEVPEEHVERVALEVFPYCMTEKAVCPALPFKVGTDTDVCVRWDEPLYMSDVEHLNLSESFLQQFVSDYEEAVTT